MRITERFTEKYLREEIAKAGITLPLDSGYCKASLACFDEGIRDGIKNLNSFPCNDVGCVPNRLYIIGKEIGKQCREDFKMDETHSRLVMAAQLLDVREVVGVLEKIIA